MALEGEGDETVEDEGKVLAYSTEPRLSTQQNGSLTTAFPAEEK